jgi:hypothetical protein
MRRIDAALAVALFMPPVQGRLSSNSFSRVTLITGC